MALLAQTPAPPAAKQVSLPLSAEENAVLYKVVAEAKLLQEYQKEVASQLAEKQAEWKDEATKVFERLGKKEGEWVIQEDSSGPKPKWVLAKPAAPAAPAPTK